MNQTLIKKIKKMLPQEIRDIIKKEADELAKSEVPNPNHHDAPYTTTADIFGEILDAYTAAATKYAELMIEFAKWVGMNEWKSGVTTRAILKWYNKQQSGLSTSDLLAIFLKEKSKS